MKGALYLVLGLGSRSSLAHLWAESLDTAFIILQSGSMQ